MNPPSALFVRSRILTIAGVAAAYFLSGKLGLLLATSPGYATALWPPSGIALAAILLFGNGCWPGVLIGSFLVNVSISSIGIAAAIGGGATVQAILGGALVRRFAGTPLELVRGRQIAVFLLLGGPVSCVANPTIAVSTLALAREIQPNQIPFNWWTWWVGDVIGVVVVTPLVLIALAPPRDVWRRRAGSVAVPLALMLLFFTALFVAVSTWERAGIASRFQDRSEALASSLRSRLKESVDVLRSFEGVHAANPAFRGRDFRALVEGALARLPSIQALSWNPRIQDADRPGFEQGGADGACPIVQNDAKGLRIVAPRRSDYVPIRYIEPHEPNAAALGYDVSCDIVRSEALTRACDTGQPAATRKLRLVQENDPTAGIVIFLPVYSGSGLPESLEERRRRLAGYFACALRLKEFFKSVDGEAKAAEIDVSLEDSDAARGAEPFWRSSGEAPGPSPAREFRHATRFSFAGRNWLIDCRATAAYVSGVRSWRPWGILAGGMMLTGFLGAFLLAATGRAILLERPRGPSGTGPEMTR